MSALCWLVRWEWARLVYRLADRTHNHADPLCVHVSEAAMAGAAGRGWECRPCARDRRLYRLIGRYR